MPEQGGQCPFCQLISNPEQLLTVGETENFYAWLEVNPRARGHTMIVPKQHTENILEFSKDEWQEAFNLTREVVQKAKDGLGADGVSITVNVEEAGGQMLPHAYIQVFPRFQEDENAGTPTGAIFPQQEELQQELNSIQDQMSSISFNFEGETHEPHPESQKFKDEDEIEGLLTGGMGSSKVGPEERGEAEEESEEHKNEDKNKGSDEKEIEREEVEIDQMSDREVLEMLIDRHGGPENFLECEAFRKLLNENSRRLIETRSRSKKSSFDWQ